MTESDSLSPVSNPGDVAQLTDFYVGADFLIPESVFDIFSGALWEAGTLGLEYSDPDANGNVRITAFFPRGTSPATVMERVTPWLRIGNTLNISDASWNKIERADWNALWKSSYQPIEIGKLVILPSWSRKRYPDRVTVKIKPQMAFGTGSHATTHLCLEVLQDTPLEGAAVADLGTGSGILAIAAAKLGARSVDACDPDPEALANAVYNARINRVLDKVQNHHGTVTSLPDGRQYDCVVANITLGPLKETMAQMAARLAPGGLLYMSGMVDGQEVDLLPDVQEASLVPLQKRIRGEWILLKVKKP
jgi:ribosomal protein L11 methyltransferase